MAKNIFVSYTRVDEAIAQQIVAALDRAGLQPWIDMREIKPGDSYLERMNEGLGEASYVLVLLSRNSLESQWVQREWLSTLADRATILIPIVLDNTEIPPLLRDIVHFDLRGDLSIGVARIVEFFQNETCQVPRRAFRDNTGAKPLLAGVSRRQLRLVALKCVDNTGLSAFCFDASLDPNSLAGTSLHEKLVSLLHRVSNEDLLNDFASWLELERSRCVKSQLKMLSGQTAWNWTTQD
jgi:hypothetical protein